MTVNTMYALKGRNNCLIPDAKNPRSCPTEETPTMNWKLLRTRSHRRTTSRQRNRKPSQFRIEQLEDRLMLDAGLPSAIVVGRTLSSYTIAGVQNNQLSVRRGRLRVVHRLAARGAGRRGARCGAAPAMRLMKPAWAWPSIACRGFRLNTHRGRCRTIWLRN
jgi:hypothetical protein